MNELTLINEPANNSIQTIDHRSIKASSLCCYHQGTNSYHSRDNPLHDQHNFTVRGDASRRKENLPICRYAVNVFNLTVSGAEMFFLLICTFDLTTSADRQEALNRHECIEGQTTTRTNLSKRQPTTAYITHCVYTVKTSAKNTKSYQLLLRIQPHYQCLRSEL